VARENKNSEHIYIYKKKVTLVKNTIFIYLFIYFYKFYKSCAQKML